MKHSKITNDAKTSKKNSNKLFKVTHYNNNSNKESKNDKSIANSFVCGYCGKSFGENWVLTRHIIQVEQKKMEKCNICGKECTRLKEHINMFHPSKKSIFINSKASNNEFLIENVIKENIIIEPFSLIQIMTSIYDKLINQDEINYINKFVNFNSLVLGIGKFSKVNFGCNKETKEPVAIKTQIFDPIGNIYIEECKILKKLDKSIFFPKFKYFQKKDGKNILVESLFGPTLDRLFSFCNYNFDIPTISKIGIDILSALEDLHGIGYLHLDIKPSNMAILFMDEQKDFINSKIGLLDLDNSISFLDEKGVHYKKKNFPPFFKGTAFYASIDTLKGECISRRDDIENLFYVLFFFYIHETPWSKYDEKNKKIYTYNVIEEKKKFDPKLWIGSDFEELIDFYLTIKKINYYEEPNYSFLKKILYYAIIKNNEKIEKEFKYNWEKKFVMINQNNNDLNGNENLKRLINDVFIGYPKDITIKYLKQFK